MRYFTEAKWYNTTDIEGLVGPKRDELAAQGIVTELTRTVDAGIITAVREWPTLESAEFWAQFCLDAGAISCITKTE